MSKKPGKCAIIIPARLRSTRLPGKLLKKLAGKPLLYWSWLAAGKAGLGEPLIAADSREIMEAAKSFGAKAVMTDPKLQSGTDRVWAAAKGVKADFIINFQADEPFMKPGILKKTFLKISENPDFDIATAVSPIKARSELNDPNCVKAVLGKGGRALYFSRLPVPYAHPLSEKGKRPLHYRHLGFYVYRTSSLSRFVKLGQSPLEKAERLEQLRALENGMSILAHVTDYRAPSVDTLEDLKKAEKYFLKIKGRKNV